MFKHKILITVLSLAIILAISVAGFLHQQYTPPIIMYHMIDNKYNPTVTGLIVSPQTFERQMRFLKEHQYNVITLDRLASLIKEKKKIPPKTISITLDDGYRDNYTNAFPILKKYNLPATIFLIFNEIGRPQNDRLSWQEIRIMLDSGIITFGSHTLGPDPLINIKSEEELKKQIFDSKRLLEAKLGRKITLFSYPEGMFNPKIRQLVIDAGYTCAVATNPGKDYPGDDIFALKRIRISENARDMFIFAVETSGFYTFMKEYKKHGNRKK